MLRRVLALLTLLLGAQVLRPAPAHAQWRFFYLAITGTSTITGADQNKPGDFRGVMLVVNVTTLTGTAPTITVAIQGKDDATGASGNYIQLHANFAAISATGTYTYIIYPTLGVAAGGVTGTGGFPVNSTWRCVLTYGGTVTASAGTVSYYLVP
jgi:hypothetical protein